MKQTRAITPLDCGAQHLTVAINVLRIYRRMRSAVPTFKPARNKAARLKARLHGIWKR